MKLIDSHCHIHDSDFEIDVSIALNKAKKNDVAEMITVGTGTENSRLAVGFASKYDGVYALIGIHPGQVELNDDVAELEDIIKSKPAKLVGLGDIGLDYHYKPFDRRKQIQLFESQLELAVKYDLPASFHVREALDDFWAIFDSFSQLKGTLHCYTDGVKNMEKALERGLYISINGIVSFNKELELEQVFCSVPTEKIILETDAPYLAPKPHRGKINQPAYILDIAKALSKKRDLALDEIAKITTNNTQKLFNLVK